MEYHEKGLKWKYRDSIGAKEISGIISNPGEPLPLLKRGSQGCRKEVFKIFISGADGLDSTEYWFFVISNKDKIISAAQLQHLKHKPLDGQKPPLVILKKGV